MLVVEKSLPPLSHPDPESLRDRDLKCQLWQSHKKSIHFVITLGIPRHPAATGFLGMTVGGQGREYSQFSVILSQQRWERDLPVVGLSRINSGKAFKDSVCYYKLACYCISIPLFNTFQSSAIFSNILFNVLKRVYASSPGC